MPLYAEADLWDAEIGRADLLLVTANACLRYGDQALVMGRGAASQMARRFPGIERAAGRVLLSAGRDYYTREGAARAARPYGLLLLPHSASQAGKETYLGLFQVKWHWREPADPALIEYSARSLAEYLQAFNPMRVALNFPGIGNGGLAEAAVRPILDRYLPEAVVIYRPPAEDAAIAAREPRHERERAAV